MIRRLNRGIRAIGSWPWWVGFFTGLLWANLAGEPARRRERTGDL